MKKLLDNPLHAITIVILLAVGALYWYAWQQQERYDAAANAWLRSALADIGSWQRSALQRHLAPEALAAIDDAHMDALVARYRELGAFESMSDVQFGRLAAALSFLGGHTLLGYSGVARFRHGSAHFTATLIVRDDSFRFYNINFGELQRSDSSGTAPAQ